VCCSVLQCVASQDETQNTYAAVQNTLHFLRFKTYYTCTHHTAHTYCSVLQCVAVCCSVLQCGAVCCSVLPCVALAHRRHTLQCIAVYCSVLQCVALCCSVLHCVAVCCSVYVYFHTRHRGPTLQHSLQFQNKQKKQQRCTSGQDKEDTPCSVLLSVAVCCRVLQGVAVRYSVLQCVAFEDKTQNTHVAVQHYTRCGAT